jgi:hypothetical protein
MTRSVCCTLIILLAGSGCAPQRDFLPLFNGRDLTGWRIVNTDASTWTVRDDMIVTSGKPIGELCTTRQYENYVLEIEWRHMEEGGNAGLFLHSDPLPAVGQPFTRAIESQVMDGNHGDVFAIHGATMIPDRPHPEGWMRSLPVEERANPTGAWNHYRVESRDGTLTLAVNGEVVSGGTEVSPRKGYICLESEGSEAHFRNIRLRELPSTNPPPEETADEYDGFVTLYNGVDLSGWRASTRSSWQADDWTLRSRATEGAHLWTEQDYEDFELITDYRLECESDAERVRSALFLRGETDARLLVGCRDAIAGEIAGEMPALAVATEEGAGSRGWRRLEVRVVGGRAAVMLDGAALTESELPPGTPSSGAIGLAGYGADVAFANLFVKPLTD